MEISTLLKIKENPKLYLFLTDNSYFYRLVNRDSNNYEILVKEFKKYPKEIYSNKINDTIDNIDTISDIIKLM